jgi:glutamine synthetase
MTALETYVSDKERNENVKKVRKKIDELGIEYIYYQFISVTGRIVGKGYPC